MKYYSIGFFLTLVLGSCNEDITVFVHHEAGPEKTFRYKIYVDSMERVNDSLPYSGAAPGFKTYYLKREGTSLKLSLDTINREMPIRSDVKYYSFFLVIDTITGKNRVVARYHKSRPGFE